MAAALPKRTLGNTGLSLSVLGFGASPLGGIFGEVDDAEAVRAVHRAFALGINYFDTAPFYGILRSEKVLGQALKDLPRSEIVVSSKVGRYGENDFDFSAARVKSSVHESLQRLQLTYLDIVICHDVEFVDLAVVAREAIPALAELKQQGLIKAVGFSGLPHKMFTRVLELADPGKVDMVLSWAHCSMVDQSLMHVLMPQFKAKGLGVINASPLSMGLLTPKGPVDWHPAPPELKAACKKAAEHAKSKGVDISKVALTYSLRVGEVTSTLVGMASTDLVEANVSNARQAFGLDPNPNAAVEEAVMKEVEEILKPVQGMTWASGRPENN